MTTLLCVALAVIYEFLGHGVYSFRIRLLFALPLAMLLFCIVLRKKDLGRFLPAFTVFRMFIATGIARNAFIGIVFVYGTASSKSLILAYISGVLLVLSVVLFIISLLRKKK